MHSVVNIKETINIRHEICFIEYFSKLDRTNMKGIRYLSVNLSVFASLFLLFPNDLQC